LVRADCPDLPGGVREAGHADCGRHITSAKGYAVHLVNARVGAGGKIVEAAFSSLRGYDGKEGVEVGNVGARAGVGVVAVNVVAESESEIGLCRGGRK